MATKKRGLGRGLDALLADSSAAGKKKTTSLDPDQLTRLPVERIRRGRWQPRTHFDEQALAELADSIRAQGMVQPVVVRATDDGHYELIAGERRWRAAQLAELREIPAVVRDVADDVAMAMALIENIQRQDLNPLEEAGALQRLRDEYGLTHEQVATAVGRSRTAVTNLMRLTELADEVKTLIMEGALEMGHARALLGLPQAEQAAAARRVAARKLTVRQTEALVRDHDSGGKRPGGAGRATADPDVQRLEQELAEHLGAKVALKDRKGKGQLVISYHTLDELEGILARLRK